MRALVTGITGFAGRHLAAHLLAAGDAVAGVARRGRWPVDPACPPPDEVPVWSWDLAVGEPPPQVASRLADFDPQVIYHLAALSLPDACGDPEPTAAAWNANVAGTERVLAWAARRPRPPRVIVVSSSQVYAPVTAAAPRVSEDAPLAPRRGYGQTKLAAERAAAAASQAGLPVIVARAFQHAGPGQEPPLMLAQWAAQLTAEGAGPVEIYTRDAWIDLSDVRDVVRAYRLLAERGQPGVTYNVGAGEAFRSGAVLERLLAVAGSPRGVRELRPGPKHDPVADVARLVGHTGWKAQRNWRQMVAETWDYWRRRSKQPPAPQAPSSPADE